MRITLTFSILLMLLMGCSNNSPEKRLQQGPWGGPFGTQMGISKQQIERYTGLAGIGDDGQSFAGKALPDNYGVQFESIIYTINSVEGLCALSLVSNSDEDIAKIRSKIEAIYGSPTIERADKYATWDKKNMNPPAVIAINYAPSYNLIKVFYANFDRCKLL